MSGPRPVTTKVGGGISPRLAGFVAVAVLGAVVWMGVSGRPPAPPDISQPTLGPAATATARSGSTPTAVAVQPSPSPQRSPILTAPPAPIEPLPRSIPFARDKYAVMASIDDRNYLALMAETEPGRFRGSFRVPFPVDTTNRYEVKITQLWSRNSQTGTYVEIGAWPLYLAPLQEGTQQSGPVLQAGLSAQPQLQGVPRAVRRGFTLTVHAESRVTHGILRIEMQFLPRPGR